jgi:PAS domain S-box-containing protein
VLAQQAEREQRVFAEALADTTAVLNSTLELERVLTRILECVGRVVENNSATIALLDGTAILSTHMRTDNNTHEKALRVKRTPMSEPNYWKKHMNLQEGRLISDTLNDPYWITGNDEKRILSAIILPIIVDEERLGFLSVDSLEHNHFQPKDVERLKAFAHQAGIAIRNARLYRASRKQADQLAQHVQDRTRALEEAQLEIEAILRISSDAIILLDTGGRIMRVNEPFITLFDCQPDAAEGKPMQAFLSAEYGEIFDRQLAAIVSGQPSSPLEVMAIRDDDSLFDADIRLTSFQYQGETHHIICNLRDISAQRQYANALEQSLEEQRRLIDLKNSFMSIASHEFRTPLTVILNSTDLVRRYLLREMSGELPENVRKYLLRISTCVEEMTELLDDVLLVGADEGGQLHFAPEWVDLEKCARKFWMRCSKRTQIHTNSMRNSAAHGGFEVTATHLV